MDQTKEAKKAYNDIKTGTERDGRDLSSRSKGKGRSISVPKGKKSTRPVPTMEGEAR